MLLCQLDLILLNSGLSRFPAPSNGDFVPLAKWSKTFVTLLQNELCVCRLHSVATLPHHLNTPRASELCHEYELVYISLSNRYSTCIRIRTRVIGR